MPTRGHSGHSEGMEAFVLVPDQGLTQFLHRFWVSDLLTSGLVPGHLNRFLPLRVMYPRDALSMRCRGNLLGNLTGSRPLGQFSSPHLRLLTGTSRFSLGGMLHHHLASVERFAVASAGDSQAIGEDAHMEGTRDITLRFTIYASRQTS
ncbi:hypothetical protein BHE74_00018333 [Ensete ventricosum]|nr:hypothetical protein GW17_00014442 [Ensete ventricosum]RWW73753.1 hypothetical protein BHE74_00018333 [Ensete ventricosum]RZR76975.1 hypothetical protein BHM03_00001902 [Ensete ventricosum]